MTVDTQAEPPMPVPEGVPSQTKGVGPVDADRREEILARYSAEREKRLRTDGTHQYQSLHGVLNMDEDFDPWSPVVPREPVKDHVDFLFLGGGFSGLTVCARLKQAGFSNMRILESGGDFGGVWHWNRYPGAMCDTAAMVYLPMLEETGAMPSAKYVRGPEIRAQALRIAKTFDLYPHALFHTHLDTMTWDEANARWVIKTRQGDEFTATHVAMGTGPLNRPHLPGVPGLKTFKGKALHTSRWDYEATGGSWEGGPLTGLNGKRVGVIGTGATAVQCIPELGKDSGELFVFQRTPSAVAVRGNHPIDKTWFDSLEKGWQQKWLRNFMTLMSTGIASVDYVHDGWTDSIKRFTARMFADATAAGKPFNELGPADFRKAYENSDDEFMEAVRARCNEVVTDDPEAAEKLKAWYRQYCKRPCFHDEYLATFNRPNVHLVDTEGRGVEKIDEEGVWVNGTHYPLDVLVYATGFEFNSEYTFRAGLEVIGRDGQTLSDAWKDGMKTYQGMHINGFPNLFIIGVFQGAGLLSNVTSNYTDQGYTVAAILKEAEARGSKVVEVNATVQDDWVKLLLTASQGIAGGPECTPGYYNSDGQAEGEKEKLNMGRYPAGSLAYFDYIADWRTNGKFEGLEFDGKPVEAVPN